MYKKVERVNAKGFGNVFHLVFDPTSHMRPDVPLCIATAQSIVELALPKAFVKTTTQSYALAMEMADELMAVAPSSSTSLSQPNPNGGDDEEEFQASVFAVGARCSQAYVHAVDDETKEPLLVEVSSFEITAVDDVMTINSGDLSVYDANERPILHSSKWKMASSSQAPPVLQVRVSSE